MIDDSVLCTLPQLHVSQMMDKMGRASYLGNILKQFPHSLGLSKGILGQTGRFEFYFYGCFFPRNITFGRLVKACFGLTLLCTSIDGRGVYLKEFSTKNLSFEYKLVNVGLNVCSLLRKGAYSTSPPLFGMLQTIIKSHTKVTLPINVSNFVVDLVCLCCGEALCTREMMGEVRRRMSCDRFSDLWAADEAGQEIKELPSAVCCSVARSLCSSLLCRRVISIFHFPSPSILN